MIKPTRGPAPRPSATALAPHSRRVFCNRVVDLASIAVLGYDMDYTLVHYHVEAYERHAYDHVKRRLKKFGWPVGRLRFDPSAVIRGLVIDTELGNILKANRFGFVKMAAHGTRALGLEESRNLYARTILDAAESRFHFLTTLFSLSEGCLYAQLVDLFDKGKLPGARSYADIHRRVRSCTDLAYFEGELKPKILAHPERFIVPDKEAPRALLDQKRAGKKLMVITNSDWHYTNAVMSYAYNRHLPGKMTWQDLFDLVIVSSDKPAFFEARRPFYELVDPRRSLLTVAVKGLRSGRVFWGGHAAQVEKHLGVSGDQILYVGDHVIGDVQVSKSVLRWRTALVLRELEDEIDATEAFRAKQARLDALMDEKARLEYELAQERVIARRTESAGRTPETDGRKRATALRSAIRKLDAIIAPLAQASYALGNRRWGLLMRAGNEKSYYARKVEDYADLYFSRVANLLYETPYLLLRSWPGSMPHDGITG